VTPKIVRRDYAGGAYELLVAGGVPPLLARLYAARGIGQLRELDYSLGNLLPYASLKNAEQAGCVLADAIAARKRLVIVADYDADGATACAVGLRALRAFGAQADYLVPNRFEYGYGLTPEIVDLAQRTKAPDLLITVDNGIASIDGVARAKQLGIDVLVTDHHLPADRLPDALAIVDPNQPGCEFPSKHIAGVGVMFYVMAALRAELRRRGAFAAGAAVAREPNLAGLLDLVALGTVADVVRLDANNRILVQQGLARLRAGRGQVGVAALCQVAGREVRKASTYDLGFVLGPRLNAAGRLTDMSLGIELLTTEDPRRAHAIAQELDRLNRERREIEAGMREDALAQLDSTGTPDGYSVCLFDPDWHQGVIGILAARIKDRLHRPALAFARGEAGELKGSGRSIRALHLRDALDRVAKRHPGLLLKFGGHAAAAGLTLRESDFGRFAEAFEQASRELLSAADLERVIETDGALAPAELTLQSAEALEREVWGQGFAPPAFYDEFAVANQRVVGDKHLKLRLAQGASGFDAMLFSHSEPLPARIGAVFRVGVNEFNGARALQLTLEHWHDASGGGAA